MLLHALNHDKKNQNCLLLAEWNFLFFLCVIFAPLLEIFLLLCKELTCNGLTRTSPVG